MDTLLAPSPKLIGCDDGVYEHNGRVFETVQASLCSLQSYQNTNKAKVFGLSHSCTDGVLELLTKLSSSCVNASFTDHLVDQTAAEVNK